MKFIVSICMLLLTVSIHAQKGKFVRIYDLKGVKFQKGHVVGITDSTLTVALNAEATTIPIKQIGFIRTNRSIGHDIIIASSITSIALSALMVATARPEKEWFSWTAGEGILIGFFMGVPTGATVGALVYLSKGSKLHLINGEVEKWKAVYHMYGIQKRS